MLTTPTASYVLRRKPPGVLLKSAHAVDREYRVQKALFETGFPVPEPLVYSEDETILGSAFYVMRHVEGRVFLANAMPDVSRSDRAAIYDSVNATLARLHSVDHVAAGLGDFGRVEGFLERQVGRWQKQLASYAEYEGWAGPGEIEGVDRVAAWLDAHRPATFQPGIIHGDYHLANVLYRFDGPKLAAIVDWELTTIGDPLLDLGWILATWPLEGVQTTSTSVTPWDGFPKAAELVEHYAGQTTRDMTAMSWYAVLACYKLGIILEGTHARAAAGKAEKATGDALHAQTLSLFQRALTWIDA
jgi:aminoglycoside phosphotransferase (APT) family kinase protein